MIFHMAFQTLNCSSWRWTFIEESISLKLDWLGVILNVRGHFLVVSKVGSVLVVNNLFPRFDDGIGKYKWNLCMENIIFIWIYFWSGITWFESEIIDVNMCMLLIWIIEKRIVLNKNSFRMSLLLKLIMLELWFKLKKLNSSLRFLYTISNVSESFLVYLDSVIDRREK